MSETAIKYTYWQDQGMWLGYLNEYPDYMTQGETESQLQENLLDIHKDLVDEQIPSVRRHGELHIA